MPGRVRKRRGDKALLPGCGLCEGPRNHTEADVTELSQLERLLAAVAEDPAKAVPFYEALLGSLIYVPTPGDKPLTVEDVRNGAELDLMVIEAEDGRLYMPVFASAERALAYGAELPAVETGGKTYAELPAEGLIRMLDPKIALTIDLGAEHARTLDLEELHHLRSELDRIGKGGRQRRLRARGSTRLSFRAVLDLPAAMAAALAEVCGERPSIGAVYLVEVPDPERSNGKKFIALLDIDDKTGDAFKAAGEAIGRVLSDHFAAGTYFELANLADEDAWAAAVTQKKVAPVYRRGAA